jgi:hypothetical protein
MLEFLLTEKSEKEITAELEITHKFEMYLPPLVFEVGWS